MDTASVSQTLLRVAVAGAGAFGKNHLRVYRELETAGQGVALVAAIEPDAPRAAETADKYAIPVFASVDKLLAADLKLDAATVAVPTVHHHAVASALLDAGIDLLVEKPLAAKLTEADDLIVRAERGKRILQPGHLERFNPAVLAIQPQLRRPMFFESHRLSIFTPRALDVDVVLDLMIHDLDIVLTFADSPVREVRAVGLPILSPKVDIANVRVEFESGCVANFTASRVSTERVRKLRYFEPRQYVSIDYARQDLLVIRVEDGTSACFAAASMKKELLASIAAANTVGKVDLSKLDLSKVNLAGVDISKVDLSKIDLSHVDPAMVAHLAKYASHTSGPAPGLSFVKPPVTPGEPLRLEILSFLESVRTRREPRVTARQGRNALALALEIQASMAAHAQRAGLGDFFHPGALSVE
jgi:predicted dehydrogenase